MEENMNNCTMTEETVTEVVVEQGKSNKVVKAALGVGALAVIGGLIYKGVKALSKSNEIIEEDVNCTAEIIDVDVNDEVEDADVEEDDENETEIEEA